MISTNREKISIVLPCLNEVDSLGFCLDVIFKTLQEHRLHAEVIVADNGSTDGSIRIAEEKGARVISVSERGYGEALKAGITAATGEWVIMGDADGSYDFSEIPRFLEKFKEGCDLVVGCRFPSGQGKIMPSAMPWSHRWIGNPFFSRFMQFFHGTSVNDVYCGLRGFRRERFLEWSLRRSGMEFAVEMVLRATILGHRIGEIPITLHPDRRIHIKSHLKTVSDGWKTLRLLLLFAPEPLFLIPGLLLVLLGMMVYLVVYLSPHIGGLTLDAHTLAAGSLFVLLGYQAIWGWIFAKQFLLLQELIRPSRRFDFLVKILRHLFSMAVGMGWMVTGVILMGLSVYDWQLAGFQTLNYSVTMKKMLPGIFCTLIGMQTILGMLLLNMLIEMKVFLKR